MSRDTNHKKGMIALVSLILLSSILILSATTVLFSSIDLTKATVSFFKGSTAKINAQTCLEEGLRKLQNDRNYLGNYTLTYTGSSCQGSITTHPTDSTLRVMSFTNTSDGYTSSEIKYVNVTTNPIELLNP